MSRQTKLWSDLRALLDSGESLDSVLGLSHNPGGPPNPHSFENNLRVVGVAGGDQEFMYTLPDGNIIELLGLSEIEESCALFPPFLDLSGLLQPLYISEPELLTDPAKELALRQCVVPSKGDTELGESSKPTVNEPIRGTAAEVCKRVREESSSSEEYTVNKKPREQCSSPTPSLESTSDSDTDIIDLTQE